MLIVVHYCYRFLCTVVTDSCALLLPFFVHSPYHFLCTRDFCLHLIENAIRPLALGRKNYLFCGNDASAYRAAIVYSLIGTCRAAGVDPRTWMEDVLSKLPYWQRDGKDLAGLLPRAWAKENQITPK